MPTLLATYMLEETSIIRAAADQEEMACKKHGFVQSQYAPEGRAWSHPLKLQE